MLSNISKVLHFERIKPILDTWFLPDWDRESPTPKALLDLWWGAGLSQEAKNEQDDLLRSKFLTDLENIKKGEYESWLEGKDGTLAYVLICDQLSRMVFRNQAEGFSYDSIAQKVVRSFIEGKPDEHKTLKPYEKLWLYLPFEHAEDLESQKLSVQLFTQLANESVGKIYEKEMKMYENFAKGHLLPVEKFGRFPTRNKILGRENTPDEEEYLKNNKGWV